MSKTSEPKTAPASEQPGKPQNPGELSEHELDKVSGGISTGAVYDDESPKEESKPRPI